VDFSLPLNQACSVTQLSRILLETGLLGCTNLVLLSRRDPLVAFPIPVCALVRSYMSVAATLFLPFSPPDFIADKFTYFERPPWISHYSLAFLNRKTDVFVWHFETLFRIRPVSAGLICFEESLLRTPGPPLNIQCSRGVLSVMTEQLESPPLIPL